jgi:hypothetical protein
MVQSGFYRLSLFYSPIYPAILGYLMEQKATDLILAEEYQGIAQGSSVLTCYDTSLLMGKRFRYRKTVNLPIQVENGSKER